jgi:gliding motility-associated-like protein
MWRFCYVLILVLVSSTSFATKVHVNGGTGADVITCGTPGSPCQTIQYAMDSIAVINDTIQIAAGTYTGPFTIPQNKAFKFFGDPAGGTIIDGLGTNRGFIYQYFGCGATSDGILVFLDFVFADLTFQNCYFGNRFCSGHFESRGGAIFLQNDNDGASTMKLNVFRCNFIDNLVDDNSGLNNHGRSARGAAIFAEARQQGLSGFNIEDCLFKNNDANQDDNGGQGGAVFLGGFQQGGIIKNCTFIENDVHGASADCGDQGLERNAGGALYILDNSPIGYTIDNCSFYSNTATICATCCGADPSPGGAIFMRSNGGSTMNINNSYFCMNQIEGGVVDHWDNNGGTINSSGNTLGTFPYTEIPDTSIDLCSASVTIDLSATTECATYAWQDGNTDSIYTATTAGIFWVDVSIGQCTIRDSIVIDTGNSLIVTAGPDTSWCDVGSVTLQATGGNTFLWSPPTGLSDTTIANPIATPTVTTTYYVVSTDTSGCTGVDSVTITVNTFGGLSITGTDTILEGGSSNLNASGGTTWVWSPTTSLSCSNCQSPVATPSTTTTYTLVATDANGCTNTTTFTVVVIPDTAVVIPPPEPCSEPFVPNVFTPGQATNGLFRIRSNAVMRIAEFQIYNRWGDQIFFAQNIDSNDPSAAWDGTYKGRAVPPDVFAYFIRFECPGFEDILVNGNVTLLR